MPPLPRKSCTNRRLRLFVLCFSIFIYCSSFCDPDELVRWGSVHLPGVLEQVSNQLGHAPALPASRGMFRSMPVAQVLPMSHSLAFTPDWS